MTLTKLFFILILVVLVASCGRDIPKEPLANPLGPPIPIEDSGKRLSGEFVLADVEDSYAAGKTHQNSESVLSFDKDGNFKRRDKSRTEEGSYLIDMRDELVIYVERVNGELLSDARVESYVIAGQTEDTMTLRSKRSKTLVLNRR